MDTLEQGTMPLAGHMTMGQLGDAVRDGRIDTVVVAMADMQGRLIGKRLNARFFMETDAGAQLFCDYFLATDMEMTLVPGYAAASWEKGYGDFALLPDLSTLRAIPWLPGTAIVLSDVQDTAGKPLSHSPRQMLRRQIDRLAERGLVADVAGELEFYLFNQSYEDARARDYRDLKPSSWYPEDGQVFQSTRDEPYVRTVRKLMESAGIPIEGSKAEWSAGQQEINLDYAEALEMCDRLVLYKNGCKEIAAQQGKAVSFMAKLDENMSGNSCHLHLSLRERKTGAAAFHDPNAPDGMSALFRSFLAGAIAHCHAASLFYAPNVNSYKRFTAGTFAPTRCAWSLDNRTTAFRVLGSGRSLRFECRVPGADCNPYLAFAALIASGISGVEEGLELAPAFVGNAYDAQEVPLVPAALEEAIAALEGASDMARALGEDVRDHYLHYGRTELAAFRKSVTDWERIRLFERG